MTKLNFWQRLYVVLAFFPVVILVIIPGLISGCLIWLFTGKSVDDTADTVLDFGNKLLLNTMS